MSTLYKLTQSDFIHGLILVVAGSIVTYLTQHVVDLHLVSDPALNGTIITMISMALSFFAKRYLSDEDGKLLGKI